MVIVDVRPQTVGMPTDAYFAVEEIKDVRTQIHSPFGGILTCNIDRTGQKPEKHSSMSLQQSKQKKQKKSGSNISCETSKTQRPQHLRRG